MIYTYQRGPRRGDGVGGAVGEDEDGGNSRFSHSRTVKSVHGYSRPAADRAFMYVKRLQRGWQGHFNVPSVQLEDAF